MFDMLVIGGGPAGVTAALRARELGATVGLVERDRLGGTCTNDGCVPTRVLAKAARLVRDAEQYGDYGLIGSRPTIDLGQLIAKAQETVYRVHEKKQLLANLQVSDVTVWEAAGQVRFLDYHTLGLANGQTIEADKFIICAGGHARQLPIPGIEHTLTHSDIWRLGALPESVVIVGGAATGCQVASILAAFGTRVTILDVAPTIIGAEDQAVSTTVAAAFQRRGIEIITQITGIAQIEPSGGVVQLTYFKDGSSKTLKAQAIVMAVGWEAIPNS